jgi:hypothetical protein
MSRYSWSQSTLNRMLRAAERAGLSVSRVEVAAGSGNITVHTQPVENTAPEKDGEHQLRTGSESMAP